MQTVFVYNDDFTFKEIALVDDPELLPRNSTLKLLPQPNYKPIFNVEMNEWIETATAEEIANWGIEIQEKEIDLEMADYLLDLEIRIIMIEMTI